MRTRVACIFVLLARLYSSNEGEVRKIGERFEKTFPWKSSKTELLKRPLEKTLGLNARVIIPCIFSWQ
ncbi:hypothetical protein J0A71_06g14270 [Encephalitozoon cuniculi]|nr:hypothetical protein J0A71_06g14270 [Encephalitozoon cuniculi]